MGTLGQQSGHQVVLAKRTLVGRDPSCRIVLSDPSVSSMHASVRWTGRGWQLRDLGSRNGTLYNGRRLDRGVAILIGVDDLLTFGRAPCFRVVDDTPPGLMATSRDGRTVAGDQILLLPSDDQPVACVTEASRGWVLHHLDGTGSEPVEDGVEIALGGGDVWRIDLPLPVQDTVDLDDEDHPARLPDVQLTLHVDEHDELCRLVIDASGEPRHIPVKAHHRMLVPLARRHIRDAGEPEATRGWMLRQELLDRIGVRDPGHLTVMVYRARNDFRAAGLPGEVIQRAGGGGPMRVRVGRVVIVEV